MTALLHDSALVAERNIRLMARNRSSVLGAVLFPLIFLFGFFGVLGRSMDARGLDYAQFLPPIIVVQAMFFTAIASAFFLADDRARGLFDRYRSLPIARGAILGGRALADSVRASVSLVVVVGGGMLLGFQFESGPVGAVGFAALALLAALALAAGCGIIGLIAPSPEAATSMLFLPYLPLLMLSTGFVPVAGFPGWLQPFVSWQPVSLTVEALRAIAQGGPTAEPVAKAVVLLVTLLVVFVALGARITRTAS